MAFTVRVDRVEQFENVLKNLVEGLRAGAAARPSQPALGLRILKNTAASTSQDTVLFVLLAEPVRSSQDYSVEHLLQTVLPSEAPELIRRFRESLASAPPFAADLRVLQTLMPDDLLRSRLETELARDGALLLPRSGSGSDASTDRDDQERIERLRLPAWAVEGFEYRIVEKSAGYWRFAWSLELRNVSLIGSASADVVVEFFDQQRAVIGSARMSEFGIPSSDRRRVMGEIRIASVTASRVTTAAARVEPKP